MFHLGTPLWQIVVRASLVYVGLLAGFRLLGKRELGQMTVFDLVLILLIANAVQNAMVGLVAAGVLLLLDRGLSILRLSTPLFGRLFEGQPTVVIQHGHPLVGPMRRQGLSEEDLEMAVREHGIADVSSVELAVLENDGSISIVPSSSKTYQSRRRRARAVRRRG